MNQVVVGLLFFVVVVGSWLVFAGPTPQPVGSPIVVSNDVENHAYGMSFCSDGNSLVLDPVSGKYSELKHTREMFPECVFVEVQAKNFSEVPQLEGESEFENVTIVNLTCLQERCTQIVNLDQDSGHVISVWQKE